MLLCVWLAARCLILSDCAMHTDAGEKLAVHFASVGGSNEALPAIQAALNKRQGPNKPSSEQEAAAVRASSHPSFPVS